MPSLRNRIIEWFMKVYEMYPERYWNGGEIERLAMEIGYKASNASRRLRELCDEGRLDRRMNGKSVEYRFIPFEERASSYSEA